MTENVEAGREMDQRIAEKLMGWGWMRLKETSRPRRWLVPPQEYGDWGHAYPADGTEPTEMPWWRAEVPMGPTLNVVPHYSTDVAAAWQVVEKLRALGYGVILSDVRSGQWTYEIDRENWRGSEVWTAPTAPLAICRAALAATETTKQ